ncbi:hypothetical protein B0T16DRAFT_396266 [Cercophora newfieldiana]|uniref:Uncharacterized protein n=1 Tax=Cercophora newfieldiana TaxID=92897 RepID=A0AA40CXL7_9PEZI|nr:hypothetical protein B0T16DRAFT_396266 [Cercophora newfieldiana]
MSDREEIAQLRRQLEAAKAREAQERHEKELAKAREVMTLIQIIVAEGTAVPIDELRPFLRSIQCCQCGRPGGLPLGLETVFLGWPYLNKLRPVRRLDVPPPLHHPTHHNQPITTPQHQTPPKGLRPTCAKSLLLSLTTTPVVSAADSGKR